jgi:hypothetical protein
MVRAELLETVGFEFIDIQEFYSELLPNKHGKAVIGGTIRWDKKEEYLSSGGKVTQIIAKTCEGNSIVLFCRIITSCNIKSNGDVQYMTLGMEICGEKYLLGKFHMLKTQGITLQKMQTISDNIEEIFKNIDETF